MRDCRSKIQQFGPSQVVPRGWIVAPFDLLEKEVYDAAYGSTFVHVPVIAPIRIGMGGELLQDQVLASLGDEGRYR